VITKIAGLSEEETKKVIHENTILLGYRGSIAHGMYVPQKKDGIDDKDIMGVFVCPLRHYLGFPHKKEDHKEIFYGEYDCVSYEIRKMLSLLLKSNPNVLSSLWLDETDYIYVHPLGQKIIDNREIFVSTKAYHSFSGYAHAQFKRMTHFKFEGYMGEKRKQLVEKYGYDCKNAAHLIRLLKMGIEFLKEGKLYVKRSDAQQLLSIKNGDWSLEDVKKESEKLFRLAEEAYVRSQLPPEPDYEKAEKLLMEIVAEFHNIKGV
jgi:hypothetical protein